MKVITFVGLLACLGLANAGIFDKIDDATLTAAIQLAKYYIAKFDPIDKVDVSDYVLTVLQYNASKIYVSGFSDFELTHVDVQKNSLAISVRFNSIVASVDNWSAYTVVKNTIGLETLEATLNGLELDLEVQWALAPVTVQSLNVLPHVESGSFKLLGDLNGREADIDLDNDGLLKIDQLFADHSAELNEDLLTAVNWFLTKLQS
ncbi:uncharacterized protein LOC108740111 [Agrilus planipennis]|uniref:Uncharacterized protein LOC108740111 n=1 Tax=Agrilus planipennis TaxID=224129 RepID=A0A1W4X149_AGRPL|nr:uncharacterized protein LOC108740111 [Agrilus planipennis]